MLSTPHAANVSFVAAAALWMCASTLKADHSEIVAKTRPEHVLAGIDVYRTKLRNAATRLGMPDETKDQSDEDAPDAVLRDYVWKHGSCVLTASGYVLKGEERGLYWVSVRGCLAAPPVWRTSAGLALGMSLAQIKRLYGTRFSGDPRGRNRTIDYEFRDGTTLTIEFDGAQRTAAITLMAEVE
jgi:hypothetical protein